MNFIKAVLCVFLKHIFQPLLNHHVNTLQHTKMFLKNSQRPNHILWNTKFTCLPTSQIICHQTESSVKFTFLARSPLQMVCILKAFIIKKILWVNVSLLLVPHKLSWNWKR